MSEELNPPRFPTMLRKMWSGSEVQAWIDENWNRRAQPAAPADAAPSVAPEPVAWMWQHDETGRTGFVGSGFDRAHWEEHNPRLKIIAPCFVHPPRAPLTREALAEIVRSHLTSTYHCTRVWGAWHVGTMTEDDFEPASESDMAEDIADAILANRTTFAAPSVAPEPVAWTTLIEIDWVKRNAGRAGSFYAVKAGPNDIPLFAHPPRAPLTEEFWLMLDTALDALKYHQEQTRPIELTRVTIAAVETFISAHGIGGK